MKVLIWLFFATLPFYYTSDFRFYIGGLSISLNMLVTPAIILYMLIKGIAFTKIRKSHFALFVLFLFFITLHLVSYNSDVETEIFIKHVTKIVFSFIFFSISYIIASKLLISEEKLAHYLKIFVYASTLLLAIYIFIYAFVLHAPFLGVMISNDELTTKGKNQAQAYLVLVFPLIPYLLFKKFNIFLFGALIIHLFSIIYLGSKALWISLALTIIIFVLLHFKKIALWLSNNFFKTSIYMIFAGFLLVRVFNIEINIDLFKEAIDSYNKLINLFYGDISGDSSASYRSSFFDLGFEYFSQNPLLGNGLGYFVTSNPSGYLTHNDYIFFISDLGALGLISFLLFAFYALSLLKNELQRFLMLPFLIDLLFINAYNAPLFYILLGLLVGINSKKKCSL